MNHFNELERITTLLLLEQNLLLNNEEKLELEQWKTANPAQASQATKWLTDTHLPQLLKRLESADAHIRGKLASLNIPVEFDQEQGKAADSLPEGGIVRGKLARIYFTKWQRYAAAVIIILTAGTFFWLRPASDKIQQTNSAISATLDDVPAGSDKAILTLGDGSKITLDSLSTGEISQQGNVSIIKLPNGELEYLVDKSKSKASAPEIFYNTITTPNAGQYHLKLPDGSRVWLNAASSMTFPTRFDTAARKISVTGEVYFEVAKDVNRPFVVSVNNETTVEVLGTHFNINAYRDEAAIKTTLLEGKVKVSKGREIRMLLPGEQAVVSDKIRFLKHVNMEHVMAWKNGLFDFENADVPDLMRQLERWYDIKVEYQGSIPAIRFNGKMYRNENLSTVLNFLEDSGLEFKIEGKTVKVRAKTAAK